MNFLTRLLEPMDIGQGEPVVQLCKKCSNYFAPDYAMDYYRGLEEAQESDDV